LRVGGHLDCFSVELESSKLRVGCESELNVQSAPHSCAQAYSRQSLQIEKVTLERGLSAVQRFLRSIMDERRGLDLIDQLLQQRGRRHGAAVVRLTLERQTNGIVLVESPMLRAFGLKNEDVVRVVVGAQAPFLRRCEVSVYLKRGGKLIRQSATETHQRFPA